MGRTSSPSAACALGAVAIALPGGLAFAQALHACLLLGAVAVPLDPRSPPAERARIAGGAAFLLDEPLGVRGVSVEPAAARRAGGAARRSSTTSMRPPS